ncbi:hypothetical protein GCM10009827_084080 [Dactylosporangium maewongense]|uniref:Uncharacterized protein n=1 Tax=Dactylosporangium maewongense TaxID=634393 RepID=A0ABN2C1D5_9ACTN
MGTKLKSRHLSLVPPLPPAHPLIVPTTPWHHCPPWCSQGDNCYGGEFLDFGDGHPVRLTSRHHHGVILAEQVCDIDGTAVDVRIEVEAVEDPDQGFMDGAFVNIDMPHGMVTDADSAERIANAMLAAVAAARQTPASDQPPAAVSA